MHQEEIKDLLRRYMDDQLSPEESEQFVQLLKKQQYTTDWEGIVEELSGAYARHPFAREEWDPVLQKIIATGKDREQASKPRIRSLRRYWAAAAVILLLSTGAYIWTIRQNNTGTPETTAAITPGKSGAILTLADGSRVAVDSLGNGVIATQNGAQVLLQNGQLSYNATSTAGTGIQYNTMTTPNGRQFSVRLPDGTNVWLNAASSIRYPTVFNGSERKVEITGEAYFDVIKNAQQPFRVIVNGKAEIAVLGTQFNVNAYEDVRSVNTTLIAGSVGVKETTGKNNYVVLEPGQQAELSTGIKVTTADVDKVMAWKNNLFNFEGISLQDAMHQLERWYDIDVVYENGIPDIKFFGEIDRNVNLGDLLQILSNAKLRFRIEGRKLVIMQ